MFDITKDQLRDVYILQEKSLQETANFFGCSEGLVRNLVSKYGLQKKQKGYNKLPPIEILVREYNDNRLTVDGIARKYEVTSNAVRYALSKAKIKKQRPTPPRASILKPSMGSTIGERGFCEDYVGNNLTQVEMAIKYNVSVPTISRLVKKYGLSKSNAQRYENYARGMQKAYGIDNGFRKDSPVRKRFEERVRRETGTCSPKQSTCYSQNTIDIIISKQKMEAFISQLDNKTVFELSSRLNISTVVGNRLVSRYGLRHLLNGTTNKGESRIKELLDSWAIRYEKNKTVLKPYEIDFYCLDFSIGIEYNGNYWHSEKQQGKNYHQKKSLLGEERGVFIYHIFEYEWNDEKKRIKITNQLKNLFGLNKHKIYARRCEIRGVNPTEKNQFLDINHIQGRDKSRINLGLYFEGRLVSLMTFCKPRFNKHHDWELSRFCSEADCNVLGAANKLFIHFVKNYLQQNETIISYSDIAKTTGNIYKRLGFQLTNISCPNYVWVNKNHRKGYKTRYQCQMKGEKETMEAGGYMRVFDSGNKVWVYKGEEK